MPKPLPPRPRASTSSISHSTTLRTPRPSTVFSQTTTQPGNQPAFIHCASGNRARRKRVLVDKWDLDRAGTEAAALGLSNATIKTFMMTYIDSHKK